MYYFAFFATGTCIREKFYLESKLFVKNALVRSDQLDPILLSYLRDKPP